MTKIDLPVGLRNGTELVANRDSDQKILMKLFDSIPQAVGGTAGLTGHWGAEPVAQTAYLYNAILRFQTKHPELVQDGVVDPTGRTLKKMDALAERGVRPEPKPVNPTPVKDTRPLDIFVRFRGAKGGNAVDTEIIDEFNKGFNTPAYLITHQRAEALCFRGFREQEQAFVDGAVNRIIELRQRAPQGVIIILGSSAGGMSALKTAVKLTEKGIHLDFVGISDGAFFAENSNEVLFSPVRIRSPGAIRADRTESFSQSFGHSIMVSRNGFLPNTEFHAPIEGFSFTDLNSTPGVRMTRALWDASRAAATHAVPTEDLHPMIRKGVADKAHEQAGEAAEPMMHEIVKGLIKP